MPQSGPACSAARPFFVLDPDELARQIAVGRVPIRIDAERLDIEPWVFHRRKRSRPSAALGRHFHPHQGHGSGTAQCAWTSTV